MTASIVLVLYLYSLVWVLRYTKDKLRKIG